MTRKVKTDLKRGFSTGACVAAAAVGAWLRLNKKEFEDAVELLFPDGSRHSFKLFASCQDQGCGVAVVRKDAGDDPDITDKALFKVKMCETERLSHGYCDYELVCDKAKIILHGGLGVGLVTRPGLDAEPGKWALNPVPRQMIIDNLKAAGCGREPRCYRLTIEIPDGERLAQKTLNPLLGVVGGISVLGTSGYVEPYSNSAYIKTIKILLSGAQRVGCRDVALCTGGRTAKALGRDFPEMPEFSIVRIADFIADSLKIAEEIGFERVIIACMAGKLYKYSAGLEYTHAHTVRYGCQDLAAIAGNLSFNDDVVSCCRQSASVREAFSYLAPQEVILMQDYLGRKALEELRKWAGKVRLELRLYDPQGNFLQSWGSA
ncbi:MAG: cobalt-precorrin-5B (C(1))-methyltransferase CbiD [Pseudomonadota bacterium]|nr:cobalt-precorrin-5B (C(1))-methyltransferase CbiD [Pseudomonadota bacterium]